MERKDFVLVGSFFASGKMCSICGQKNNDLSLKDITWKCFNCGTIHDRDENASKNLKKEGIRILKEEKKIIKSKPLSVLI